MKSFKSICAVILTIIIAMFVGTDIYLLNLKNDSGKPYRVEVSRLSQKISDSGYDSTYLDSCEYITNVEMLKSDEDIFYNEDSDYIVRKINGEIYRFDYSYSPENTEIIKIINIVFVITVVIIILIFIFIYINIIKPFNTLKELPYELAKGNLTVPLKENNGKYFGKFVWGMDLLREKLEQQKISELQLQKEKKTLLLSMSHDIKTPLAVIELYAKALEKDLYKDEQKKKEVAVGITHKCNEIKKYVNDIIKTSSNDFLNLEVQNGEFYLSDMMNEINRFYNDKLDLLKIDFSIDKYSNCMLKGDIDRGIEVLQNVMENAVKYGDGHNISISFENEEDCLIVSITNSGCTLSENELPHIFDSFWRGSNVGSNSGSGLGLYICRQLMRKMDGDIFASCADGVMIISSVFRMS